MEENQRPNLLLISSDQQHWRAVGFRDRFYYTPAQDKLAKESVVFDQAFCTTPQCSPSRSSLLTGFYPSKTGVWSNIGAAGGNPLRQRTIGYILSNSGYWTGYFGKWHLGFDEIAREGWRNRVFGRIDKEATQNALEFLEEVKTRNRTPFALVVSYCNPHGITKFSRYEPRIRHEDIPLPRSWHKMDFSNRPRCQIEFMTNDQGRDILSKPEKDWKLYRAWYREFNRQYDENLGLVIERLREMGRYEDTIIVVTSDHGDMDTNHRLIYKGPFMYEHLVRVPLMIRVPKRFGGTGPQTVKDLLTVNLDLVPTLLDFSSVGPITCDGISLRPVLTGNAGQRKRDFVIIQYYGKQRWINPIRTIRTPRFKYSKYLSQGEELYDMRHDPDELANLAHDPHYDPIKRHLATRLDEWIRVNNDPFYSQKKNDELKYRGV